MKQVETRTVLGMKGSGKSYYAGYCLETRIFQTKKPFVILDYHAEHIGFTAIAGVKKIELTEEYVGRINWKKLILSCKGLVVYPYKMFREQVNTEFGEICRVLMEVENTILMVEEAHNLAPNNAINPYYEMVITEGRKFGIDTINISQRTADLDKSVISQSSNLVCFKLFEENDISHLKGIYPEPERLRNLKTFTGMEYVVGEGTVRTVKAGKRIIQHFG